MTPGPDDPRRRPDGEDGSPLDEEAAWKSIVENFGARPTLPEEPPAPPEEPHRPSAEDLAPLFRDPLQSEATYEDEGHFVPPTPPPVPKPPPLRRSAWTALFAVPALLLLTVVLGWDMPAELDGVLVLGWAASFLYLIATMRRDGSGGDSYDNGAVL